MCCPKGYIFFLHRFGLKTDIHFTHFRLESSRVFEETTGVYERICRCSFRWILRKKELCMYKEDLKQSLIWHSNLSYDNIFLETRSGMAWVWPGLKTVVENDTFLVWKSVRILRTWRHSPTRIPRSTPWAHTTRVVSRRKHRNLQHFHQTSIFSF